MFANRKLVIATKHRKEEVIAPLMEKALNVNCVVPQGFDSDKFGTFSGEIEREMDPLSAAREKCLAAMRLSKCDLGIASEGSFGAHPTLFFIPADDEILIFIDLKNNLEIVVREISTQTNFKGKTVASYDELLSFAESALFPSHALILKAHQDETAAMVKGITTHQQLRQSFDSLYALHEQVHVETDMRAMFNPSRMKVIATATEKLIQKIKTVCPKCSTPGFDVHHVQSGLPCSRCGAPTRSTFSLIYQCKSCAFTQEEQYPHGKESEDPEFCDFCNP